MFFRFKLPVYNLSIGKSRIMKQLFYTISKDFQKKVNNILEIAAKSCEL